MPSLRCGVNNCAHNSEDCCCLGSIKVEGDAATNSAATCCENFCSEGASTNCGGSPDPHTEVACDACNCDHNSDHKCCANSIDIAGAGASNCGDTNCSSFCECGQ